MLNFLQVVYKSVILTKKGQKAEFHLLLTFIFIILSNMDFYSSVQVCMHVVQYVGKVIDKTT